MVEFLEGWLGIEHFATTEFGMMVCLVLTVTFALIVLKVLLSWLKVLFHV